jgi:DNA-binding PadR family transcriptional regulator
MPPTRQSTAKLPLAPTVFHILLALAGGEAHGFRIRTAIIEASNGALTLDPGSLYRLIADAAAASRSADDTRTRHYKLTADGRRILKAETQRMSALVSLARTRTAKRGGHV